MEPLSSCKLFSQRTIIPNKKKKKKTGASPGQTKWGGQYHRCGVGRGVPFQIGGRVWGYNLKLICTLHNDSIPETPSGKKWSGRVHPSPPRGNAPGRRRRKGRRRESLSRLQWRCSASSCVTWHWVIPTLMSLTQCQTQPVVRWHAHLPRHAFLGTGPLWVLGHAHTALWLVHRRHSSSHDTLQSGATDQPMSGRLARHLTTAGSIV